ncbi:MAG: elongation factor Ts [Oscillospiraceae bacterium]|nr:elongation factor Ts [Oscillospiraceae bacterium]MCI9363065.1 elongation factor Ts [Oscillospiraceae bacterium]RKJ58227.1 elongation factor Ts [bacterium 1XD42-8]RKJ66941.1 elongation factor Ts [bacterium 1XD42-1]
MAFTAKDVQQLRERTSCGMMDCKKALTESGGDMDKAIELLREKGLAKQAKKADRVAAEGVVYACVENGIGVVIEVNSETDFVAKNEQFMDFVKSCAKTVAKNKPADVDTLLKLQAEGMEGTVEEALRDKVLTIGENIKIRRFVYTEDPAVTYVHGGGRIGVMVTFETDCAGKEGFEACGKDVAMQVAAINPLYVDEAAVPADVVEKEKEIIRVQISTDEKTKNKPAQVVEKMVSGKIGKYFKENCLVEQPFVKNGDQTVGQYVAETAKALGGSIKVKGFTRFEKGEGLEKREDNFAEEVAGMMK